MEDSKQKLIDRDKAKAEDSIHEYIDPQFQNLTYISPSLMQLQHESTRNSSTQPELRLAQQLAENEVATTTQPLDSSHALQLPKTQDNQSTQKEISAFQKMSTLNIKEIMKSQIELGDNSRTLSINELDDQVHELSGHSSELIRIQLPNQPSYLRLQTQNSNNNHMSKSLLINTPEDQQSCFSNAQSEAVNNAYAKSAHQDRQQPLYRNNSYMLDTQGNQADTRFTGHQNQNLKALIEEAHREREAVLLGGQAPEENEDEIDAKLKKMLGDDEQLHENEALLKFNQDSQALVNHRRTYPKFSILKARALTQNSQFMNSRTNQSRFDRKGQLIDESTVKQYGVTFGDNVKDVEKLVEVKVVESYKEHNYDNTHQAQFPICPCCAIC